MYERTPFYEKVKERLIRYVKIDTQSDPNGTDTPTTGKQFDLARVLRDELIAIGASDVRLDERVCVLYASIPATAAGGMPVGFVTHMDTAPDAPGANVRPWVLENYDGGDIVLNEERGIVLSPTRFRT